MFCGLLQSVDRGRAQPRAQRDVSCTFDQTRRRKAAVYAPDPIRRKSDMRSLGKIIEASLRALRLITRVAASSCYEGLGSVRSIVTKRVSSALAFLTDQQRNRRAALPDDPLQRIRRVHPGAPRPALVSGLYASHFIKIERVL